MKYFFSFLISIMVIGLLASLFSISVTLFSMARDAWGPDAMLVIVGGSTFFCIIWIIVHHEMGFHRE